MSVLIFTHPLDVHAAAVQAHLDAGGVTTHRLDTTQLLAGAPVTARIHGGRVSGYLGDCDLAAVTCVWHRRPTDIPGDDPARRAELRVALGGILATVAHLNHPARMAAAHKPLQLAMAGRCGMRVPETLVSTDRAAGVAFARGLGGLHAIVVKPMSREVAPLIRQGDPTGWGRAIHLTQQVVGKVADIRLTVVDQDMFAVVIRSPHLDWRVDLDECEYTPIPVPEDVASQVGRFMLALRLRYGAFDFALAPDGSWWFLEVNPNGQFLWIEEAADQPISAAVAHALARPSLS